MPWSMRQKCVKQAMQHRGMQEQMPVGILFSCFKNLYPLHNFGSARITHTSKFGENKIRCQPEGNAQQDKDRRQPEITPEQEDDVALPARLKQPGNNKTAQNKKDTNRDHAIIEKTE